MTKNVLHMSKLILHIFISRESALPSWDLVAEPGEIVSSCCLIDFAVFPDLPFY